MTTVSRDIEVHAPVAVVWAALADLEAVSQWNPNVVAASCGPVTTGLGATRTCQLDQSGHVDEIVSVWEPERALRFEIGRHGAIRSAEMGLELAPIADGTRVVAIADYHLAYGPLGPVIDQITVRRQMAGMLERSLAGLKLHVEAMAGTGPPSP